MSPTSIRHDLASLSGVAAAPPADGAAVESAGSTAATQVTSRPTRRRSDRTDRRLRWLGMGMFVVVIGVTWQLASTFGWWPPTTVPAPRQVWSTAGDELGSASFREALEITLQEVALSLVGSMVFGFLVGALFWKVPYLGKVCEPFLVAFYAIPVVVYYPTVVVGVGFGMRAVVLLATIAATIPMILNTWIGLRSVPTVYWKLSSSLRCNRRQTAVRIAIPAAAPIILTGVRLAAVYSVLACLGMEFLVAKNGLGYRIRYAYETFDSPTMFFYVIVVFVLASAIALSAAALEARIIGRRAPR